VIITSPGYPLGCASFLNVSWTINTEPHFHIEIKFIVVDLTVNRANYSSFYTMGDYVIVETGKYIFLLF